MGRKINEAGQWQFTDQRKQQALRQSWIWALSPKENGRPLGATVPIDTGRHLTGLALFPYPKTGSRATE